MKTREEIRMQFFTENNGAYWTNSQEEPDIDYVYWLEDKLINKLTMPDIAGQSKQLNCECKRATFTREVDADFNFICGKCGRTI